MVRITSLTESNVGLGIHGLSTTLSIISIGNGIALAVTLV